MTKAIPLIRAAVLVPFLRWMLANGRAIEAPMRAGGFSPGVADDPMRPIALANGMAFLAAAARREAPDFGCRVVCEASVTDVLLVARALDGARTPRETLARAALGMPMHSSHEGFVISRDPDGITIRDHLALPCDPGTRHRAQQYIASIVQVVCSLTGYRGPCFAGIEMMPDPVEGLAHLEPWLGANIVPTQSRTLTLRIPDHVLDRSYPRSLRERLAGAAPAGWSSLRADGSFAGSVRILIGAELGERVPDASSVARAAGLSLRTLQRHLAAEGKTFSGLIDDERRDRALARLAGPDASIAEIAATLGYAGQSALTRAVRRWTGAPPSQLRRSARE